MQTSDALNYLHTTPLPSPSLSGEGWGLSLLTVGLQIPVGYNGQPTYAEVLLPVGEIYRQQQLQSG